MENNANKGFPSIHPRTPIVSKARGEFQAALNAAIKTHSLTYSELFLILSQELSAWSAYAVKDERDGDRPE